jgi:Cation/multidrug efflux pump
MSGIIGRLLHEFAVTIVSAVLVSGFVSLSLTPMLCSRMLKSHKGETHGRMYQFFEHVFDGMQNFYRRTLQVCLGHRRVVLFAFGLILAATVGLVRRRAEGLPAERRHRPAVRFDEADQDVGFDEMARKHSEAAKIIRDDPNVAGVMAFMGVSGSSATLNLGRMIVTLKPRSERGSPEQIIQELRPKLQGIPGFKVYLQNIPIIRIGAHLTKTEFQYALQDIDTKELFAFVPKLVDTVSKLEGFRT